MSFLVFVGYLVRKLRVTKLTQKNSYPRKNLTLKQFLTLIFLLEYDEKLLTLK